MNAVEIEQALSELAEKSFVGAEFPFQFLEAFGNKATTIARLRKGDSNTSDLPGGVLQRNHIHIAVAEPGKVGQTLTALKASPKTAQAKAKFILATDGTTLEAEELATGDAIACEFPQFPDYFGFFLPLAGICTIKEIKDNPIDVRATGRLNKLDIESGTIYVLQSQSDHPYVAQHRALIHKIGVTGMKVETRIAAAKDDATYLLAGVTVVATYKLAHINRTKLENLFHRIFAPAQLNLTIEDRFGKPVRPREWFLVPLQVIDEAVNRVRDGSITNYIYDPKTARLVPVNELL